MGVPNMASLRDLDIVDAGVTVTLNKIRKANQSTFTITQSRNI